MWVRSRPGSTHSLEVNPLVRKQNTKAAPEAEPIDVPTVEAPTGPLDRRTGRLGQPVQDRRERFREQA